MYRQPKYSSIFKGLPLSTEDPRDMKKLTKPFVSFYEITRLHISVYFLVEFDPSSG